MKGKKTKILLQALKITPIFIVLSSFYAKLTYVTCGIFNIICESGAYYKIGFPAPHFVWKLPDVTNYIYGDLVTDRSGNVLNSKINILMLIQDKNIYSDFLPYESFLGLVFNIIFWFIISLIIILLTRLQEIEGIK